jgi:archaellum biogenesis protein FlaJ (TadC family)
VRIHPRRRSNVVVVALSIIASLILLTAAPAFGQEVPGGEAVAALFYGMLLVLLC